MTLTQLHLPTCEHSTPQSVFCQQTVTFVFILDASVPNEERTVQHKVDKPVESMLCVVHLMCGISRGGKGNVRLPPPPGSPPQGFLHLT